MSDAAPAHRISPRRSVNISDVCATRSWNGPSRWTHVECHIDIGPGSVLRPIDLQGLLDTAPNPTAPTIRQGIDAALTDAERKRFLARLQQAVNDRDAVHRTAVAHVFATKSP